MEKYLYLTESSWANAWVYGGNVPLSTSSHYRKKERSQIYTPDENIIDNSTHDIKDFKGLIDIDINNSSSVEFTMNDCTFGDVLLDKVHFDIKFEDGLVLCLANRRSNYIAKRLGKIACVKIFDIESLKINLDKQIGVVGIMDRCEYTKGHARHHFLKSHHDSWQDEYRIFWPNVETRNVLIPSNTAQRISIRCVI